jgi:hypothetical protein
MNGQRPEVRVRDAHETVETQRNDIDSIVQQTLNYSVSVTKPNT